MWGITAILLFIIVLLKDCIGYFASGYKAGHYTKNTNELRQRQLYQQYVMECKCLTPQDWEEVKRDSAAFAANLKSDTVKDMMTIDDNDPYRKANFFVARKIHYYASLTGYERYLMAKERAEREGFVWEEKLNPDVPDGSPDYLYKLYIDSGHYYVI